MIKNVFSTNGTQDTLLTKHFMISKICKIILFIIFLSTTLK